MIETSDFGAVAVLGMRGIRPIEKKVFERRVVFCFADSPSTREVLEAYETGVLEGPLVVFNVLVKNIAAGARRESRQ